MIEPCFNCGAKYARKHGAIHLCFSCAREEQGSPIAAEPPRRCETPKAECKRAKPNWLPKITTKRRPEPKIRPPRIIEGKAQCKTEGCLSSVKARDLCQRCYDAERRSSRFEAYRPWIPSMADIDVSREGCIVIGCDRDVHIRRFCRLHYETAYVSGFIAENDAVLPKKKPGPPKGYGLGVSTCRSVSLVEL